MTNSVSPMSLSIKDSVLSDQVTDDINTQLHCQENSHGGLRNYCTVNLLKHLLFMLLIILGLSD